jgi:alanine racemase
MIGCQPVTDARASENGKPLAPVWTFPAACGLERAMDAEYGPPLAEAGGILTIDLGALVANWRELARRAAPAACAAVVKADAYGCGLEPVTRALVAAGCETFFVAHLAEGRRARAVAPHATVYILNGLLLKTAGAYARDNLRPVICSLDEASEWNGFCRATGWRGTAALQIDTGMNRLGLSADEVATLAADGTVTVDGLELLMSHFACSEEPAHPLNARQMARFRALRASFPEIPGSLANSSGIFLDADALHDLVRPGVALYGANPTPGHDNPMVAVLRLDARVVQIRDVPLGETVGYGATWTAKRPTRLAIVSAGYADGYLRSGSSSDMRTGAAATVGWHRCPVAGRISMDLTAVDVTDVPQGTLRRGDTIALLDESNGIDDMAADAGTIAYEVLTSLGRRYHRIYVGEGNG